MYKISWIKFEDEDKFNIPKRFGMEVYNINDLEKIDDKLRSFKEQKYNTIVISSTVASFSGDIITKYKKDKDINIIIS